MASSQFASMGSRTGGMKTEPFDMDQLFDFTTSTTQPSSATPSSSRTDATPKTASHDWNTISPYDREERNYSGPSHDYSLHRQQVGLPSGSMATMPSHMYEAYDSGIDGMGLDSSMTGWSSGIDFDADMNVDFNNPQSAMPAMFFPASNDNQSNNFVNPNTIGGQEEPTSNVGRLWPGMHSQQAQQAAMAKAAQAHAVQSRQLKLQAQQAPYRQPVNNTQSQGSSQTHGQAKSLSHANEPHVEESISRLLSKMRQNSTMSADGDDDDGQDDLPHIHRMKKDEEEMDDDERLLASDEGKKLSSKERRQLRNKVSARAFRSRRKEYISQLEGELALKTQETNTLRTDNTQLMDENVRYRSLIETLLRHQAFQPFMEDISKDPSVLGVPRQLQPQPQQHQPSVTPTQQHSQPHQQQQQGPPQQDSKPEYLNFDASQLQIPQAQPDRVGLAMIPENDFSKLNINGFNSMNFNSYQRVNAFAVTEVPEGPDPVNLLAQSSTRLPHSCSTSASTSALESPTCNSDMNILLAKLDGAARSLKS